MLAKEYHKVLENELGEAQYLLMTLLVGVLQLLKQVKLELLAEALPLPILFESRRKKLRRFLRLDVLTIEKIWLPCLKELLKQEDKFVNNGMVYVAIDRTNWGIINILMVSIIYDNRAIPVYWTFLDKKGSSNLNEQKYVFEKVFDILKEYKIVILGDREFCSVSLGKYLGESNVYFCLRQKKSTNVSSESIIEKEMRELELSRGTKLFLNGVNVTKSKGFGKFNLACKWKKTYRGVKTKEPWFILTNLDNLDMAIKAYKKRFDIEEMFRDFKSGGYSLEGSGLSKEFMSKLLILVSIAYTSAILQGQKIKNMGIQKYVTRPEKKGSAQRRHSSFYVGQHLHHWLHLYQMFQKSVERLMHISRHRLSDYIRGQQAISLAISIF